METIGAYSPEQGLFTFVSYTLPAEKKDYVNSLWKYQEDSFDRDVINSYNDGPLENGDQLGPFYELESSSPAAALQPGEEIKYMHTTIHLRGDQEPLDQIFRSLYGESLDALKF